jgi:arginine/ornithine transport system permease protein
MNWPVIVDKLPAFAHGLGVTLGLLLLCLATGLALALPLAVARVSARRWLAWPVWLFTYVFRGTPLLVQLFIIYFGLAQFDGVRSSLLWPGLREPWFCAWLAFSLNTAAYTVEIFAGALRATPVGEVEAARAYGLRGATLYRRILLPSALRRALPQYSNEVVATLHATAIVSTVTLVDVTRVARDIYANHFLPAEAFGSAAVIYFSLTFVLVGLFRALEHRYLRHLRVDHVDRVDRADHGGPTVTPSTTAPTLSAPSHQV